MPIIHTSAANPSMPTTGSEVGAAAEEVLEVVEGGGGAAESSAWPRTYSGGRYFV